MSAIQLFDKNSELRFDGTSVGGGGSQPSIQCYGPLAVAHGTAGLRTAPTGALLMAVSAGSVVIASRCVLTEDWDGGGLLKVRAFFGDHHDYWDIDGWDLTASPNDGLGGANQGQGFTSNSWGARFELDGEVRVYCDTDSATGTALFYLVVATPT